MAQKHRAAPSVPSPIPASSRADADPSSRARGDAPSRDDTDEPSSELAPAVARNVRRFREARGLSRPALAERAGISAELVTAVEDGRQAPTISLLWSIATALGIPFSNLVQSSSEHDADDEELPEADPLVRRTILRAPAGVGPATELYEWTLRAGAEQRVPPDGASTIENVLVTSGRVLVRFHGRTYPLSTGQALDVPGDADRSYQNPGDEPAVLYVKISRGPQPLH